MQSGAKFFSKVPLIKLVNCKNIIGKVPAGNGKPYENKISKVHQKFRGMKAKKYHRNFKSAPHSEERAEQTASAVSSRVRGNFGEKFAS